jgi:aspartate carbamoyltransferase regulatory subunit
MEEKKIKQVNALESGTVIDHIPSEVLFKVINILGLEKIDTNMTFGMNLESKRLGKKGIIKISARFPDDKDLNKIALVAPDAKINIIKDYKVVEKKSVQVPEVVVGIAKCMNPKCVTNVESFVTTKFSVLKNNGHIDLKCHYCEKITDQQNIEIN